jgi:hypothetical protein
VPTALSHSYRLILFLRVMRCPCRVQEVPSLPEGCCLKVSGLLADQNPASGRRRLTAADADARKPWAARWWARGARTRNLRISHALVERRRVTLMTHTFPDPNCRLALVIVGGEEPFSNRKVIA